ncbi:Low affinity immunoglobulin epsilon Fc receptor, partial [Sciurus carolinensis]|nr:Low affinity immunoglobulin epsilon Fc receptor [Sciurus carolinensis]
SQVSRDLHRYQSDQMAQKSQAAQLSRNMQELRARQKQMESQGEERGGADWVGGRAPEPRDRETGGQAQGPSGPALSHPPDSELSWNLDRLLADLSDTKSQSESWEGRGWGGGLSVIPEHRPLPAPQGLNQRRAASDSLEKLQEEVEKLRIQILVSKGSACNTCPEQWLHFQQKCYYFGKGAKRWVQARFTCSDLEGRLVSIHSQEEQDFLTKHANKRGSWIGLRDLDLEGEFIWMDGSPVGYSNWNPGEPNNQDQGEDCVMMRGSGKWNDASCRSQLDAWVCERLATCGPPAPSASGDLSEPAPPRGL